MTRKSSNKPATHIRNHWTVVSTLLGLISSVHPDLPHGDRTSDHRMQSRNYLWATAVVAGSISSIGDQGIHWWWDQKKGRISCLVFPYVARKCLPGFPVMVFQFIVVFFFTCFPFVFFSCIFLKSYSGSVKECFVGLKVWQGVLVSFLFFFLFFIEKG